jgi:hypothetical protein
MSSEKKYAASVRISLSPSSIGSASAKQWVELTKGTIGYFSLLSETGGENPTHREDFTRLVNVAAKKKPQAE